LVIGFATSHYKTREPSRPPEMCNRVFIAVVVIGCLGVPAAGQFNTGEIAGRVTDASGAVVPGVAVVATHAATGFQSERLTDESGSFFLPSLPIGDYVVSAQAQGFQRATASVTVAIGQTLSLSLELQVGDAEETIVINESAPLLQRDDAEISDVIDNATVLQTPLNGRQFLQLAQLTDGVVIPPGGTRGAALQQAGPLPNVGGQRSGHNIYLLDGVKVTDELFNNLVINPSIDSIQEFKIQKSLYAAEFGGKSSALINVATKSGGNRAHGSLYGFARNDRFDAHNYFDDPERPVPPLRQNQFGFSLGGPIRRNRTFFFTSYEGQRARRSITRTFSVPTMATRAGDFSGDDPVCNPFAGAAGSCSPFPNNQVPVDSVAAELLKHLPEPTATGSVQNLTAVEREIRDLDQFSVRLDHRFTDRDNFFARFSTFDGEETQPFGTSVLNEDLVPGFGRLLTTKNRNLAIGHFRSFGTRLVNEFRFGWLDVSGGQVSQNRGIDFASEAGLMGTTDVLQDMGFPQVSTSGQFNTFGDPTSFFSRDNAHVEFFDNVLIDRGKHRIKFGVYFFRLQFRPENPESARGAFTYTGQWTRNPLADLVLGYPTSAQVGLGRGAQDSRTSWLHGYVQDDWQASSNLTLNVGFRYEINQHMRETENRLSSVDVFAPGGRFVIASDGEGRISNEAQERLPSLPIPWVTSNEIGWDRSLLRPGYNRYAPRFGLAWRPRGQDKTVLRAGYGIFLNQWAYSVQTALTRNLPFFQLKRIDAPSDVLVPTLKTASILTSDASGTIGGSVMDYNYRTEYTQTWSAGIQHEIAHDTVIEAFYMGSRTTGADNSTIRNVPEPGPGPIDMRRPVTALGAVRAIRFDGNSLYQALTLKAQRRFARGLSFLTSYTLSRSTDDASSPGATAFEANVPQNVRDIRAEWALSSFNHTHLFSGSATYRPDFLDFAGGWKQAVAGDWSVSGVARMVSGAPFTVNLGVDRANIGSGPAQRPDVLGDPNLSSGRTPDRWFNVEAFSMPVAFTFGNSGRNNVTAPGLAAVDFSARKHWPIKESAVLAFSWDIFNLFNRANFDVPSRIAFTPNFGRIFSASNAREMQFGLRLEF
jgi:hypothetical protein